LKRITQKDLARALGLDVSTVSKALKGDQAIAEATRERVASKARELGFSPDPMLTALASYRNRQRPESYRATLGWIYNHSRGEDMSGFAGYEAYYAGATARAKDLGYRLEPFWMGDLKDAASLERILQARGIQGVVVAPQAEMEKTLPLDWSKFSAAAIGYTLAEPGIDRVTNDHFATMTGLLERLTEYGYRRIGCYLWQTDNERMARRARSAFEAVSRDLGSRVHLYRDFKPRQFLDWVQRYDFDAVVCRGAAQLEALVDAGYRVPDQMGLAGYALDENEQRISGMQHNNRRIGAAAIEWVSGKIQRSQFGRSEFPQRLLITSQWLDRQTLQNLISRPLKMHI